MMVFDRFIRYNLHGFDGSNALSKIVAEYLADFLRSGLGYRCFIKNVIDGVDVFSGFLGKPLSRPFVSLKSSKNA